MGQFDGTRFINENVGSVPLWSDYGKDCYCALTFNDLPREKKPVMIGWMNNWQYADKVPTSPWRGQMTIPREITLRTFPEGIRLVQTPVNPLENSGGKRYVWKGSAAEVNKAIAGNPMRTHSFKLNATFEIGKSKEIGLKLFGNRRNLHISRVRCGPRRSVRRPVSLRNYQLQQRLSGESCCAASHQFA